MKKCSFCGKEYPDDAALCAVDGAVDGEVLCDSVVERKVVTGVWRGVYDYGERKKLAGMRPVAFTLKLKHGWMEHFTGSVHEDPPQGAPGIGAVDGYFNPPTIEFTKQMPVGYITGPDGTRMTLREYILAKGHKCEHDLPSAPISYQGTFLDTNRVQGTWIINPRRIPLPGGLSFSMARASGFWCIEFVTVDTKIDPTGGPTEPLFDKSLLSPRELDDVEGATLRSLGKFNVADTEKILKRFEQEDIRFEINRDDTAIRQMSPIVASVMGGYSGMAKMMEIFVHPEDVAHAEAIIHRDDKV
jgi:hypothetical protein